MSHPYHEHMQYKKEHSRVAHIAGHHLAHGGSVSRHPDEREDIALIRKEVKSSALKHAAHRATGGAVKQRQDRVKRARGGRAKHKGHTNVNVIVAPQGGNHPMGAAPMPAAALAGAAPAPAAMPPRLPAPMGPAAGAPGMPPGLPPGIGPRRYGGRAYAHGGGIKSGNTWESSLRAGTKVQHTDGKLDGKFLGRGKPVTYKTGGAVFSEHGPMGPKLPGGSGGERARVWKSARSRKHYAKA